MILDQVKQNRFEVYVTAIIVIVIMSFSMFYNETAHFITSPENGTPVFYELHNFLFNGFNTVADKLVMLLLMTLEIFVIIILNSDFELTRAKPTMFLSIYIPLSLSFIPFNTLLPEHIAGIFIVLGTIKILACHGTEDATFTFFDAGLFFGCATILCLPAASMLIVGFVSMFIFRPLKIKTFIVFLLGMILPLIFCAAFYFLRNGSLEIWNEYFTTKFLKEYEFQITYNSIITLAIYAIFLLIGTMLIIKDYPKFNLLASRAYRLMFVIFTTFVATSLLPQINAQVLRLTIMPITILFVTVFQKQKYTKGLEFLFILFLLTFVSMQILWYRL